MQRFRGGLVFKAHRLLYHTTLGLRVIKKKEKKGVGCTRYVGMFDEILVPDVSLRLRVWGLGYRV